VKAVEFIYIPLRIKNTGEISGGTAGWWNRRLESGLHFR
jgi:hypothetical protein